MVINNSVVFLLCNKLSLNQRKKMFNYILGQSEIVCSLLNNCLQLEIDARNCLGFTPLMKAALQGRTKCAKFLLYAGIFTIR